MYRCPWFYIFKCYYLLIFINSLCWNFFINYLTKNAVCQYLHLLRKNNPKLSIIISPKISLIPAFNPLKVYPINNYPFVLLAELVPIYPADHLGQEKALA